MIESSWSRYDLRKLIQNDKDNLIQIIQEESNRKIYQITEIGTDILQLEKARIEELYRNSREV